MSESINNQKKSEKLFLVNCEIIETIYMEKENKSIVNHIVEADNEKEVKDKVKGHYEKMESPYYQSYIVNIVYVNELIK